MYVCVVVLSQWSVDQLATLDPGACLSVMLTKHYLIGVRQL